MGYLHVSILWGIINFEILYFEINKNKHHIMINTLVHIAIDPVLSLAYFCIRILMIALPVLAATFVFTFFIDIFYYFLMNAGF